MKLLEAAKEVVRTWGFSPSNVSVRENLAAAISETERRQKECKHAAIIELHRDGIGYEQVEADFCFRCGKDLRT